MSCNDKFVKKAERYHKHAQTDFGTEFSEAEKLRLVPKELEARIEEIKNLNYIHKILEKEYASVRVKILIPQILIMKEYRKSS